MKIITEQTIIKSSPEKIWHFITNLHLDGNYKKWHPKDHIFFTLQKGDMGKIGGVAYFEEKIGKSTLKLSYKTTKAIYPSYLEYKTTSPLSWLRMGRKTFRIEPVDSENTRFIAYLEYGYNAFLIGKILDWIAEKTFHYEDIYKHISEEGQNLKMILENYN